jgi:serine/threonine-protein kinase
MRRWSAQKGGSDVVAARLFDPAAGRQLVDRYELIGELASGGMATVYLARITGVGGFQRFVALKRLHPHLALDGEFIQMFLDEARLAASIHHNNVVPILEVNANDAIGYYLVMEYIEGDTLARLLARAAQQGQRIPLGITLRIALDLLAGLHAAHELRDGSGLALNLVHRDVSPQNLLVGLDGIARITDFGVARAASRLSATRVGQLKGKVAYMAPEQAQGTEEVDRRADLFSAGVVIWEALASRRLFKADSEAATLARVKTTAVPALSLISPEITSQFSDAVLRALEREPSRRYATAAEFADALEAAAQGSIRIATARELGSYVEGLLGAETNAQREAVRLWLLRNEPSPVSQRPLSVAPPMSSVSGSALTLPDRDAESHSRRSVPRPARGLAGALLAALLVGFGASTFYAVRMLQTPEAPVPAVAALPPQPPRAPAPAPVPPPAVTPTPVEPPAPDTAATATPAGTAQPRPAATPRPLARAGDTVTRVRRKKTEAIPENPYR